jgi:hypothetical protein
MSRLVGYTMRLWCHRGDYYFTPQGGNTNMYKPVLSVEQTRTLWKEYAISGAFLQLPIITPVYDYRRRC